MKRLLRFVAPLAALLVFAGCSHIPFFGRKSQIPGEPKPTSKIATETEKEFEQRWVTKRSGELVSQGMTAEASRAQALAEFKQTFPATHPAQQQ